VKWDKLRFVGASNVDLPILGADPSGPYILKGVEGLDPPPVDVVYAKVRGQRGKRQTREPQYRQVVALLGLQPEYDSGQSASDLREEVYGLLTPKFGGVVRAQVMLGNTVICEAVGDLSNIDASIFTKDPEVQITLDTDYGYLLKPTVVKQTPVKQVSGAETLFVVDNEGNAPAGFFIEFTLQSAAASLILRDESPTGEKIEIAGPHAAGDAFIIDTRAGLRKIDKIPSGQAKRSVLNDMSDTSTWLQLHGGDNTLRLNVTAFDWRGDAFVHTPAYWGV
jgi:hypothetical protein